MMYNSKQLIYKVEEMSVKEIENGFIEAWKPLFDAYPNLDALPVYAWGRNYKYENVGSPFEYEIGEHGFSEFPELDHDSILDRDLLSEIDDKHNIRGGNIWTGVWGDFSPDRYDMVKLYDFDDRFARAVLIIKDENGNLVVDIVGADTNE